MLDNLSDYRKLTPPLLRSLSLLLELLPSTFNERLGESLFDHLGRWLTTAYEEGPPTNQQWKESESLLVAQAIIQVFCKLGAIGAQFLERLVDVVVAGDEQLSRFMSSTMREPLSRYLLQFPDQAVRYFLQRAPTSQPHVQWLLRLMKGPHGAAFRTALAAQSALLLSLLIDPALQGIGTATTPAQMLPFTQQLFSAIAMVRCVTRHTVQLLRDDSVLSQRLKDVWQAKWFKERLHAEETMPATRTGEVKLLVRVLIDLIKAQPDEYNLLFDLLEIFTIRTLIDTAFLKKFFNYEMIDLYTLARRQTIINMILDRVRDRTASQRLNAELFEKVLIPLIVTSLARGEGEALLGKGESGFLYRFVKQGLLANALEYTDPLKMAILQFLTVLLHACRKYPFVNEAMNSLNINKDYLGFAWNYCYLSDTPAAKSFWGLDDITVKYAGYVVVCHMMDIFSYCPPTMLNSMHDSLIEAYAQEQRHLARQACDCLIPMLARLLAPDDGRTPQWVWRMREAIVGENAQQTQHIWTMLVRHADVFYPHRMVLVTWIAQSLTRQSASSQTDNRRLALDVIDMLIKWEQRSISEASAAAASAASGGGAAAGAAPAATTATTANNGSAGAGSTAPPTAAPSTVAAAAAAAAAAATTATLTPTTPAAGSVPPATPTAPAPPATPSAATATAATPAAAPAASSSTSASSSTTAATTTTSATPAPATPSAAAAAPSSTTTAAAANSTTAATAANTAATATMTAETYRMNARSRELLITFLVHIAWQVSDTTPNVLDFVQRCLNQLDVVLRPEMWLQTPMNLSRFDALMAQYNETQAGVGSFYNIQAIMRVLMLLLDKLPREQALQKVMQVRSGLEKIGTSRVPHIAALFRELLQKMFKLYSLAPENRGPSIPEVDQFYKAVKGIVESSMENYEKLGHNNHFQQSLQTLELLKQHHPGIMRELLPASLRVIGRIHKDMSPPTVGGPLPPPPSADVVQVLVSCLLLVSDQILNADPQTKKNFVQLLQTLGDKPQNANLLSGIIRILYDWSIKHTDIMSNKDKASTMNRFISSFQKRFSKDPQFLQCLDLVLKIFKNPDLCNTDFTQKLEAAFMIGLRSRDAEQRAQFFEIYDKPIRAQSLFERLDYCFNERCQKWDTSKHSFWVKQCLDVVLAGVRMAAELQPQRDIRRLPSLAWFLHVANIERARNATAEVPPSLASISSQFTPSAAFKATAADIVLPLRALCHADAQLAHDLWCDLFPLLW